MSIIISIVSHHQGSLVASLLTDLQRFCMSQRPEVILTLNCRETINFSENDFNFGLTIIENKKPKGFGANHNAAFRLKSSDFFGVLNPDLQLTHDPLTPLLTQVAAQQIGVVAPLILNRGNTIEDNARRLPTPIRLLNRYGNEKKESRCEYSIGSQVISPDWVAGIFMLFPSPVFAQMNGFNERYRLYFEDVDLCSRLRLAGYKILLDPRVSVIHNARRDSHRKIQYLKWHIMSGLRFFTSRVFWISWFKQVRPGS